MGELNFGRLLRRSRVYSARPAVHDLTSGHQFTYGEHLERIERLCSVIRGLGIDAHDRLGVLAGGSHVYVELWRATLAGAAVLNPLNSRLAPDELVYILNDSGTEVVFGSAPTSDTWRSCRCSTSAAFRHGACISLTVGSR